MLRRLDRRYQTRYGLSVVANLERIKSVGPANFLAEETAKWTCPNCGALRCMHKPQCEHCGCIPPA